MFILFLSFQTLFRPSDDATIFPYLIPSNFFANEVLLNLDEIALKVFRKENLFPGAVQMAIQIASVLENEAIISKSSSTAIRLTEHA